MKYIEDKHSIFRGTRSCRNCGTPLEDKSCCDFCTEQNKIKYLKHKIKIKELNKILEKYLEKENNE